MATINLSYASSTAITITLTSLGDGGYRESTAVDNTTNLYMDALVGGSIAMNATISADGSFTVYAYGSWDGGTNYTGGLAGTDETITWGTTPSTSSVEGYKNLMVLGVVNVDTTDDGNDIEFGPFGVAQAFGGVLPPKWGIVILNNTGAAFDATGTNNAVKYSGIEYTSA